MQSALTGVGMPGQGTDDDYRHECAYHQGRRGAGPNGEGREQRKKATLVDDSVDADQGW